ncbi:MAG TPA: sigma-70 family RNA polymerase sigma factor [Steroidobacteraceae bacterium]|nr:sigma-70 family RNA polymerase sigma factor [Steroidobacteraceae bacterium]
MSDVLRTEIVSLLPRLRRFARAIARNTHDADDLVQTTIERALARSEQLRADSKPSSWLFGILRNAWIDESRARSRRSRVLAPAELADQVADPASSNAAAGALAIEEAMAQLPEEQRTAVALVLIEGLSYAEAAEVMGVPVGTLTSRLARGRATLQTMLA